MEISMGYMYPMEICVEISMGYMYHMEITMAISMGYMQISSISVGLVGATNRSIRLAEMHEICH